MLRQYVVGRAGGTLSFAGDVNHTGNRNVVQTAFGVDGV